jgi:TPP-dependent pyruvate/acetoin dehydrogenase alpha subunit
MKFNKEIAKNDRLIILYKTMLLIRHVELTLARVFADGEVPGFIHLCIGQEAVAVGVASAMRQGDTLATTHRGHGHVLARGLDLDGFFKEIMGRAGGICQGRGGSMHIADMRLGIIGANGIVGAGIPISVGSALAMKLRKTGGIAVAIFGDGAMAEGVFHESLNLAALLKLPILFVCENNGWSEFSRTEKQFSGKLNKMAEAFGIGHCIVDGNDVERVADEALTAMERLRNGEGPSVLECLTHRTRGHFEGDAQKYRTETEVHQGLERDPLTLAAVALQLALVSSEEIFEMQAQIELMVSTALANARLDAPADFESAVIDVYTPVEG